MPNSYHYLTIFILYIGPFNSLILIVDARLIASLRGPIDFLHMYMFCLVVTDPESKKCMHVVDLDFYSNSQKSL